MQQVILISPDELQQMIDLAVERKLANISFIKEKELIFLQEACELTGFTKTSFYNLVAKGRLPKSVYLKSGKKLVFRRTELLEWFEKRNSDYVNFRK